MVTLVFPEVFGPFRRNIITSVMAFGGEIFERGLGHESGGLMNGVSALNKEAPDFFLTSSTE